jgi:hypothetical protein
MLDGDVPVYGEKLIALRLRRLAPQAMGSAGA